MAANKFSDYVREIVAAATEKINSQRNKSWSWFLEQSKVMRREAIKLSKKLSFEDINKSGMQKPNNNFIIGTMFLFRYDPKLKATLPYYDLYPLVFPIELYNDGFLGINLHYLPPNYRANLMDALYTLLQSKDEVTENDRLRISYKILKNASKFIAYKPCVKRYLFTHIRSQWTPIPPTEWEAVLFLPLARFMKANEAQIWKDSKKIINS